MAGSTLYGTAAAGGSGNNGTVFKLDTDGSGFTTIYTFTGDGAQPQGGVILSGAMLYGTTEWAGSGGSGTIFALNTNGTGFATLYSFSATDPITGTNFDGANPCAGLVLSDGNLFATTFNGGSAGDGALFTLSLLSAGQVTEAITWANPAPIIYGTALGPNQLDATASVPGAFAYNPTNGAVLNAGANTLSVAFTPADTVDYSAATDTVSLVVSPASLTVTAANASRLCGAANPVFTGTITGVTNGDNITATYNCSATASSPAGTYPIVPSLVDPNNRQTNYTVSLVNGTLTVGQAGYPPIGFTASPTNGLVALWVQFNAPAVDTLGVTITNWTWTFGDGATSVLQNPSHTYTNAGIFSPTLFATDQNGIAIEGFGPNISAGCTEVYTFGLGGSGFGPSTVWPTNSDGIHPQGLVLGGHRLYGVMSGGGSGGSGTIFAVNTDGSAFTNLYNFSALAMGWYTNSDGAWPEGPLVLSGDTLYGAAPGGGDMGGGTVFKIGTNGSGLTTLFSFSNGSTNGSVPNGLVLSGGALYGTARFGGQGLNGTVFKLNTDGSGFALLHSFDPMPGGGTYTNDDGAYPASPLLLAGNSLYGTTTDGGASGGGTLFKLDTDGLGFTVLHTFTNSDGLQPSGQLLLAGSTLYGTAAAGGSGNNGTVFKLNTDGSGFTTIYTFTATSADPSSGSYTNGDGAQPPGGVILSGAMLYGTTQAGGNGGSGTIFEVNTNGTGFATLYNFSALEPFNAPDLNTRTNFDGANPCAGLVLSDGNLCATTFNGGSAGDGALFALSLLSASQVTEVITWANPAPITYGTALGPNQLDATASVPGAFAYNPTSGAVLNAGANTLSVIFTPTDTVDYSSATDTVSLVVSPASLTVTAANANRAYGQANPVFTGTITGVTNGDNITATYSCSATASSPAGTYPIVPSLVDPNNRQTNYTLSLVNGTLTVGQAAEVITWANPAPIIYGASLTPNQLNATANVPGSFAYNPTSGAVLNAGANTLSVIFTPTDTVDYSSATDTVSLVVSPASLTVTAANAGRLCGAANPVFTGTITGLTNGDNITATYSCSATASSPAGTYPIVPSLVDPNNRQTNYTLSLVNGTLTVGQAAPQISIQPTNQSVVLGGSASFSVSAAGSAPLVYQWQFDGANLTAAANATLVLNPVAAANAGTYDVVITNAYGSVTSAAPTLSVLGVPVSFVTSSGAIQYSHGQFHLTLSGLTGQGSVLIEASTDLTHWTPIFTNPPTFGTIQFVDPATANFRYRYYRATTPGT